MTIIIFDVKEVETKLQWLRYFRRCTKLSQTALANKIGVTLKTIYRWERGEGGPDANEIKKLCEVLGCNESELLNGPTKQEWKLEMITNLNEVIKMSIEKDKPVAELHIKQNGLAITLAAAIDLWKDDNAFETIIQQLRDKRAMGLRDYEEGWA